MTPFIASAMNEKHIRLIADALNACPIGKQVTHHQMARALGKRPDPSIVQRARRLANQESGAVFRSVRGIGYERMPANQAASVGNRARAHIRRTCRQTYQTISNSMAQANDLTAAEVRHNWQEISAASLLEGLARDRALPKIPEGSLPDDPGHVVRKTLDAMRAALGRG